MNHSAAPVQSPPEEGLRKTLSSESTASQVLCAAAAAGRGRFLWTLFSVCPGTESQFEYGPYWVCVLRKPSVQDVPSMQK